MSCSRLRLREVTAHDCSFVDQLPRQLRHLSSLLLSFFFWLLKLPHPLSEGLSHPFAEDETQKNLYCVRFYVSHFLKFLMGAPRCLIRLECTTINFHLCRERGTEKAIKVSTELALFPSRQRPVQDGDIWTLPGVQPHQQKPPHVLFSEQVLS